MIQLLVTSATLGDQALRVLMDLQVQKDFQVLRVLLGLGVLMGRKVGLADPEYRKYLVHLVSVVTQAIQVLRVRGVPLPLGPQALLVHLERVDRKESPETLRMAPQGLRERGVSWECQG